MFNKTFYTIFFKILERIHLIITLAKNYFFSN